MTFTLLKSLRSKPFRFNGFAVLFDDPIPLVTVWGHFPCHPCFKMIQVFVCTVDWSRAIKCSVCRDYVFDFSHRKFWREYPIRVWITPLVWRREEWSAPSHRDLEAQTDGGWIRGEKEAAGRAVIVEEQPSAAVRFFFSSLLSASTWELSLFILWYYPSITLWLFDWDYLTLWFFWFLEMYIKLPLFCECLIFVVILIPSIVN